MVNQVEIDSKEKNWDLQKLNKLKPKFILLMKGFAAKQADELVNREEFRLTLTEIQQLIISCFLPAPKLPFKAEWFQLLRVLKAEKVGIFLLDFDVDGLQLPSLFNEIVKFEIMPDWVEQLLSINLSSRQAAKLSRRSDDSLSAVSKPDKIDELIMKRKKISKLDLLLSPAQMLEEGYCFPRPFSEIRHTIRKRYKPVTENSPLFSLDCEMCLGEENKSVLTRVSVVDEHYNLVLDTLVKPDGPIKNYLTRWSGITKEMLDPVDITLSDVKKILKKIIPRDAILCGQSLNNDLKALETFHPYVIDTSVIYNLSGNRSTKAGLAALSSTFLDQRIQQSRHGHCSIEDARATMRLVNLKLERGLTFADRVLDKKANPLTPVVSFNNFLKLYEADDVKIYYDYINTDMSNKFISVFSQMNVSLMSSIFQLCTSGKSICIVISKDGYCYIKV